MVHNVCWHYNNLLICYSGQTVTGPNSIPELCELLLFKKKNESIVYAYDPETKLQSSQWKSTGSPKTQKSMYAKKAN